MSGDAYIVLPREATSMYVTLPYLSGGSCSGTMDRRVKGLLFESSKDNLCYKR